MSTPTTISLCAANGCDNEVPQPRRGYRKWCSERCRKQQYGQPCVDCGLRTTHGAESAKVEQPRCATCATLVNRTWTTGLVVERIREWAKLHGEPPAVPDWSPPHARTMGDLARAQRFEEAEGHWPYFTTVFRVFGPGGWNRALAEAGFSPRPSGGVAENNARRRDRQQKVTA